MSDGVELGAVYISGCAKDPFDLSTQRLKIGAGMIQLRAGAAKLCGGDEIHGVGDLFGILNALHAALNLLGACHRYAPRFPA